MATVSSPMFALTAPCLFFTISWENNWFIYILSFITSLDVHQMVTSCLTARLPFAATHGTRLKLSPKPGPFHILYNSSFANKQEWDNFESFVLSWHAAWRCCLQNREKRFISRRLSRLLSSFNCEQVLWKTWCNGFCIASWKLPCVQAEFFCVAFVFTLG